MSATSFEYNSKNYFIVFAILIYTILFQIVILSLIHFELSYVFYQINQLIN